MAKPLVKKDKDLNTHRLPDLKIELLDGSVLSTKDLHSSVLLIVNTASQCGYTSQYAELEKLSQEFKGAGLKVIAFPCNQFGKQEPGDIADINNTLKRYGVTFPVAKKVDVKGRDAHPLFVWLRKETQADISWNFNKFLVGPKGKTVKYFDQNTDPFGQSLRDEIKALLQDSDK